MFASVALIGTAASGVLFGSVFLVPAAVAVGVMRPGGWGGVPGIRVALRRPRVFRRRRDAPRGCGGCAADPGGVEEAEGLQAVGGPAQQVHVEAAGAATRAGQ